MRALFLLAALPLMADGLSDLKTQLGQLQGQDPVKGQLDRQLWQKDQDGKEAPKLIQGSFQVYLEDGPQGLRVQVPQGLLAQARKEQQANLKDPDKEPPTARALRSTNPVDLSDCLNGADGLLRDLAQSSLLEERNDTFEGQPAKLLILKAEPKLNAQARKAMKSMDASLKVWIGADGIPLALEESVAWKASRFFISFEGTQKNSQRFRRVGNRLLVLQKTEESSNSGFGTTSQRKTVTKFQPA
jgi:hypothetical protein